MCGSHIDTVRTGGRYDGNLGVLAGLEVIETVVEAGLTPPRPLAVGFFTDEEGARFAPDMLGSLVYVGGMPLEEALDIEGIDGAVVGAELERIGYDGPAPLPGLVPHAFVELHVEQGPVLEVEGVTIGAVDGVQGISWQEVTITGQSQPCRHDADVACVETPASWLPPSPPSCATWRSRSVDRRSPRSGWSSSSPNLVNVIPASATFTVDLRNTDEARLCDAERRLADFVAGTAEAEGCTVETRTLARFEPVTFDPGVVDLVERTAAGLGHTVKRMPSGAGHDAQMLARVCPTAMVFTPSRGGSEPQPGRIHRARRISRRAPTCCSR